MLDDLRWLFPTPGAIMLRVALLALLSFPHLAASSHWLSQKPVAASFAFPVPRCACGHCQVLMRLLQLLLGQPQLFENLAQLGF